jgi:hypothetical protein
MQISEVHERAEDNNKEQDSVYKRIHEPVVEFDEAPCRIAGSDMTPSPCRGRKRSLTRPTSRFYRSAP